jgi:Ca2+-binding EF-hand superfamily protein
MTELLTLERSQIDYAAEFDEIFAGAARDDSGQITREHQVSIYTYAFAFREFGLLSSEQFRDIRARLVLTSEEVDALPI